MLVEVDELEDDFFLLEEDDFFFDEEEEDFFDEDEVVTVEFEVVLIGFCCLTRKITKKTTRAKTAVPRRVL